MVNDLIRQAEQLGATFRINQDGKLQADIPDNLPKDLLDSLVGNGEAILPYIQERTSEYALPFPIGYGGLPVDLVRKAESELDLDGITDPYDRKLRVIQKLLGHYWDTNDQGMISHLTATYHKFRHNDPDTENICGMCTEEV